jgi:hypothetical protein
MLATMFAKYRFPALVAIFSVLLLGFVLFGLPYSKFNWSNLISGQPYSGQGGDTGQGGEPAAFLPLNPDGSRPALVTILCDTAVFDVPGGVPVVTNGQTARVLANQRFFVVGEPVADKTGRLWQAIFVSGRRHPFIPLSCIR